MLNFCERTGHLLGTVIGYTGLQMVALFIWFPRIACHYSQRAIRLAELIQHPGAIGIAYQCQGVNDAYHADIEGQIEHGKHGAASYRTGSYWNIRGWGLSMLIMISGYIKQGNYQDAHKNTIELIQFGRDMDDNQIISWGLFLKGTIEQCTGKVEESIYSFKQTIELAKAVPDYMYVIEALGELGRSLLKNGKMNQALESLEESRRLSVERNMRGHCIAPSLKGLTETYLFAIEYGEKAKMTRWIKKANIACQDLFKYSKSYQTILSETFRLKGTYEWLRHKPSKATKWWEKSLHFSAKKGFLYEEAITHFEIGTRLNDRKHIKQGEIIFNRIGVPLNPSIRDEL